MNRALNAALAVVLPLMVMAAWTAKLTHTSLTGRVVHLPVTGYDPRDLLSGHYLRYAVDLGPATPCANQPEGPVCVCLPQERVDLLPPDQRVIQHGQCQSVNCELRLQGECRNGRFESGLEKFYFPESYTLQLATVPPGSRVEAVLDGDGRATAPEFYVGNNPLKTYLKAKTVNSKTPEP